MFAKMNNSSVCDERLQSDEFLCKRGKNKSRTFAKVMIIFFVMGRAGGGGQEMQGGGEK